MPIEATIKENDSGWVWVWLTMADSQYDGTWGGEGRYRIGSFQVRIEDREDLERMLESVKIKESE
jgi:hypothetical protein